MDPQLYNEEIEDVPHVDLTEKTGTKNNITDIISEPVVKDEKKENTEINPDDFADLESAPGYEDKNGEEGEDPEPSKKDPEGEPKNKRAEENLDNPTNRAVSRLMKPSTILKFYNITARRIGRTINSKNPDCLALDSEDMEDLEVILQDTVEEENWQRFPAKWMLLIVVTLIVISKIMTWNKPKEIISGAADQDAQKKIEDLNAQVQNMNQTVQALEQQNKMLQEILDRTNNGRPSKKMWKEFDISNPNLFDSETGALIDKSKIGQKGWSPAGRKHGQPSRDERTAFEMWKDFHGISENIEVAA